MAVYDRLHRLRRRVPMVGLRFGASRSGVRSLGRSTRHMVTRMVPEPSSERGRPSPSDRSARRGSVARNAAASARGEVPLVCRDLDDYGVHDGRSLAGNDSSPPSTEFWVHRLWSTFCVAGVWRTRFVSLLFETSCLFERPAACGRALGLHMAILRRASSLASNEPKRPRLQGMLTQPVIGESRRAGPPAIVTG